MDDGFGVGDPDVVVDVDAFVAISRDDAPGPADLDIDGSVLDAIEQELADVEQALALLDEGTYGQCETCGRAIDDTVLARAPATRLCADHLPLDLR